MENIQISQICGICAGCKYAINTAEKSLTNYKNVTLFKELVHNKNINDRLIFKGIKIENNLHALNSNQYVILRAHGEPPTTYEYLDKNNIKYADCTCTNVKIIHDLVYKYSKAGYIILILGKYGKKSGIMHPEIEGTVGWCNGMEILIEDDDDLSKIENIFNKKFYLICQTTFNTNLADILIQKIEALARQNHNELITNKSICNAQKLIYTSSSAIAQNVDFMIVVGSQKSSNSTELANNLSNIVTTIFIEDINQVFTELKNNHINLNKNTKIGLTAGASVDKQELITLKNMLQNEIDNSGE